MPPSLRYPPRRRRPLLPFPILSLSLFFFLLLIVTPQPAAAVDKKKKKGGGGSSGNTAVASSTHKKKKDPYLNKGKTLFWLMDPRDNTCLGSKGFSLCDGSNAFILAERREGHVLVALLENDTPNMCLERKWCHSPESPVSLGPCKSCGSKHWAIQQDRKGLVVVSEDKGKNCLVRSKPPSLVDTDKKKSQGKFKRYKNTVEMQHCTQFYTGLVMTEVPFNDGFFLQTADGVCFDGERFRPCDLRDYKLRWSVGVRFANNGEGERFFYKAYQPELCLLRTGKGVPKLGDCSNWGAKRWSIKAGQLAQADGTWCLVRHHDNSGGFEKCAVAYEFISAVPYEPAAVAGTPPTSAGRLLT